MDFATSCTPAAFSLCVSLAWSYKNTIDAARENDFTNSRRSVENKNIYVHRLNRVIWWYQKPTYPAPNYSEFSKDRNIVGLIGVFLAFDKVGIEFGWVMEPFFKDTPFGKRLYEWQG